MDELFIQSIQQDNIEEFTKYLKREEENKCTCLVYSLYSFLYNEIPEPLETTLLHGVASIGGVNIIRKLVYDGININACDFNNFTPLHIAVEAGNTKIIQELINLGANVNATTSYGSSVLFYSNSYNGTLQELLKNNINLNINEEIIYNLHNKPFELILQYGRNYDILFKGYNTMDYINVPKRFKNCTIFNILFYKACKI